MHCQPDRDLHTEECIKGEGCHTAQTRLQKLEAFYHEVIGLTFNHDVLGDSAVVYPSKLGKALEKVNPDWYNEKGEEG